MLSLRSSASRSARHYALQQPTHSASAAARTFLPLAASVCQARSALAHSTQRSLGVGAVAHSAHTRPFHATAAHATADNAAAVDTAAATAEAPSSTDATAVADAAAAATGDDSGRKSKRSKFKIYTSVSERRQAIQAEARARAEATELASRRAVRDGDADPEELADLQLAAEAAADTATELGALDLGPDGDAAAAAETAAAAERVVLKPSQVHGIAAKRLALQKLHPLKMFMTSPAHGLDKVRIIPWSLSRAVDRVLEEVSYQSGLNAQNKTRAYAQWHVANRSASEFAVLVRVFDEVVKRMPSLNPTSVLDFGAATNMGLWALQDSLNKYANRVPAGEGGDNVGALVAPIKLYRSVESNTELSKFGTKLTAQLAEDEDITVIRRSHLPTPPTLPKVDADADPDASPPPAPLEQSGVVLAPFSLGLVPDDGAKQRRQKTLDSLWGAVAPGGVLVLVEAGSIEGFATIRKAREYLLDTYSTRNKKNKKEKQQQEKDEEVAQAANVLVPCGSNGVCPMGDLSLKRSCWFRTELLTSSLPLRTPDKHMRTKDGTTIESFSYVVLTKGPLHTAEVDAQRALGKWQAKEKDVYAEEQMSAMAQARRDSEEARALLWAQEHEEEVRAAEAEAAANGQEQQQQPEQDASPETDAAAQEFNATSATDAASATAEGEAGAAADADADADASADADADADPELDPAPVTKRTDLSDVAHLLPSDSVPAATLFDHQGYARIMRKPLKRGEHVILDLCNHESKLERRIVSKSYGIPYTLARSVGEGDLWPLRRRMRDPSLPPTISMMRRAELQARKAKRAALAAQMDESEAAQAARALKDAHRAEKAEKRAAKKQAQREARDAAITARGGEVRIPVKQSEKASWEEMERLVEAQSLAEMEKSGEAETAEALQSRAAAAAAIESARQARKAERLQKKAEQDALNSRQQQQPFVPEAPTPEDEADPDFIATQQAAGGPIVAPSAADIDEADTAAAAATSSSSTSSSTSSAAAARPQSPKAKALRAAQARPASQMPAWMRPILAQTRRAPGGLEYVGPEPQQIPRADGKRDFDDTQDDESGEYTFEADPTIRQAKLRKLGALPLDKLSPTEALELKRAQLAEKKAIQSAQRAGEKESRARSPLAVKREAPGFEDEAHEDDAPAEQRARTSQQRATKHTRTVSPLHQSSFAAAAGASSSSSSSATPAATAAAGGAATDAPLPPGVRLPKWAQFRKPKAIPVPVVARPDNTPAQPTDPRIAAQNRAHASASALTEREQRAWQEVLAEASKSDLTAAKDAASSAKPRSSFFKSEQTAVIQSSLPPHLARLVDTAAATPEAKHMLALAAQMRAQRDEAQSKATSSFFMRQHWRAKKAAGKVLPKTYAKRK